MCPDVEYPPSILHNFQLWIITLQHLSYLFLTYKTPSSPWFPVSDIADKDYNRGLMALKSAVAEEEKRIDEEDRSDVANYRKGIVNARRQSLIYRNQYEVILLLFKVRRRANWLRIECDQRASIRLVRHYFHLIIWFFIFFQFFPCFILIFVSDPGPYPQGGRCAD